MRLWLEVIPETHQSDGDQNESAKDFNALAPQETGTVAQRMPNKVRTAATESDYRG